MNTPLIIAFGSQITGRTNSKSDYDFGVFAERAMSLSERTELAHHISKKLNINEDKIDLVDLYSASPILKFEVARNGKLIEGSAFDFIRYKVHSFKEYNDTAKLRRIRENLILQTNVA